VAGALRRRAAGRLLGAPAQRSAGRGRAGAGQRTWLAKALGGPFMQRPESLLRPHCREVLTLDTSGTQQGGSSALGASWHRRSDTPLPRGLPARVLFQDLQQASKLAYWPGAPSWQEAMESHCW
jgi:hypothetical protein